MSRYTVRNLASGVELASVEKTTNWTTTNTAATDITSMSITFTVGSRPVYVTYGAADMMSTAAAGTILVLYLLDGATIVNFLRGSVPVTGYRIPLGTQGARISTPGSHTVKLQTAATAAGTLSVEATVNNPIWLRAVTA